MSLNWDASNVRAFKQLHSTSAGSLITESLVWASLFTGCGHITAENWRTVYTRSKAAHRALDLEVYRSLDKNTNDYRRQLLTPGMVRRRIGLRTNASRKTDAAFKKWLGETLLRQCAEDVKGAR